MSHLERTAAALEEINPPVAAAIRVAGTGGAGLALPGLLGWLPPLELLQLTRACWLAGTGWSPPYPYESATEMAQVLAALSCWRSPRNETEEAAVHEAVLTWSRLSGRIPLVDLMAVQAGKALA